MTTDADDPLLGQILAGQFHVLERLGAGGMGAVYLADQSDMGRRVVIKVMHPELTIGNPQAVERFKREARAVAALNHPHIVQVYVFGQADDGRMYLAMEFIEGRDLGHEIRTPLPQGRALKILDQVAAALGEAHAHGVVHRDLKPENIMLANRHGNPDWVKVLDFGIAKIGAAEGKQDAPALTQQGAIFGTPRYMAPEQITGGTVDARTDLYALGVILYEMLTGEHPFRATSALDYLMKHANEEVVMPSIRRPDLEIHPKVEEILERLLAKKQSERFQSGAELQREVRAALGAIGEPLSHTLSISAAAIQEAVAESARASTVTHAPSLPLKKPSKAWLWVTLALLVVGGSAAAIVALGGKGPGKPEPVALLTPAQPSIGADTTQPAQPDTLQAAIAETAAPETLSDVQIPRAGSPIEGFPVPDGTTLASTDDMQLNLESTLSGAALVAFYKSELAGRIKPFGSGFQVTDPTSPWTNIYITNNGDRLLITVTRRTNLLLVGANSADVADATPQQEVAAAPDSDPAQEVPVQEAKPQEAKPEPRPEPTTGPVLTPNRRLPGRNKPKVIVTPTAPEPEPERAEGSTATHPKPNKQTRPFTRPLNRRNP